MLPACLKKGAGFMGCCTVVFPCRYYGPSWATSVEMSSSLVVKQLMTPLLPLLHCCCQSVDKRRAISDDDAHPPKHKSSLHLYSVQLSNPKIIQFSGHEQYYNQQILHMHARS